MYTLTIATTVAVLLVSLKLGDLILTDQQQRTVQRFCDEFALRLAYANVGKLYRAFRAKAWRLGIYLVPVIAQSLMVFVPLQLIIWQEQRDIPLIIHLPIVLLSVSIGIVPMVLILRWMWRPSNQIFDWLLGVGPIPKTEVRVLVLVITVIAAVKIPSDLLQAYIRGYSQPSVLEEEIALVRRSLAPRPAIAELAGPISIRVPRRQSPYDQRVLEQVTGWTTAVNLTVLPPCELIAVDVCLFYSFLFATAAARFLLWILRTVMWRIATYSKGAWAAIIALLATLLAVGQIFLRLH